MALSVGLPEAVAHTAGAHSGEGELIQRSLENMLVHYADHAYWNVLERAGIKDAHGLAAVTNSDTLNAAVAHTARAVFNVPIVVVRNYDPALRPVIEAFGLQTVSSTTWGAQRVEELLTNPLQKTVYSAGNGEVEVYEITVPDHLRGLTIGELLNPAEECFPVALTRAGRSVLPEATTAGER